MPKRVLYSHIDTVSFIGELDKIGEFPISIEYSIGKKRSLPQNALFWMWMHDLSKFLVAGGRRDASPQFCHDLMCNTFLGCENYIAVNAVTGEKTNLTRIIGTSGLKKGDFTHLLNNIYHKCLDWGLTLPIPVESQYKQLMDKQNE